MHDGPLWVANTLNICVLVLLFTQPLYTHTKTPCKSGRVSDPSSYNGRQNPDRRALGRLPLVSPQNWLFCVTFLLICVITSHNRSASYWVGSLELEVLHYRCTMFLRDSLICDPCKRGRFEPFILRLQMTPLLRGHHAVYP
jgi:hypothetical protein